MNRVDTNFAAQKFERKAIQVTRCFDLAKSNDENQNNTLCIAADIQSQKKTWCKLNRNYY